MINSNKQKQISRARRHAKIRTRVSGTSERPRLSVFKSNTCLYAQLIDDVSQKTLLSFSTKGMKGKNDIERASVLGRDIADKAKTKNINTIVFDRGGYRYIGKIKALADGAREGGLKF
jgi:large subunit ribosomal protein L18